MSEYFTAIQAHLHNKIILDVAPNVPLVATTCDADSTIFTKNPITSEEQRYTITFDEEQSIETMAIQPNGKYCLVGGNKSYVSQINFLQNQEVQISKLINLDQVSQIYEIKYSRSGEMICIGGNDQKSIIYYPNRGKTSKCRPGHSKGMVVSLCFSSDQKYLLSIGTDQRALIYVISKQFKQLDEEPRQVASMKISSMKEMQSLRELKGCFHMNNQEVYLPGSIHLQMMRLVNQRWEEETITEISHNHQILVAQIVEARTIVTSSDQNVCVWNIRQREKLYQIDHITLNYIIPVSNTFYGVRKDGKLYRYIRELKREEVMDVEDSHSQRIQFQPEKSIESQKNQGSVQGQEGQEQDRQVYIQKKSKADKMITCFPQPPLSTSTNYFQEQRFRFVNTHGCIYQRKQAQGENIIECQFNFDEMKKTRLFMNRNVDCFDLNPFMVLYASENQFGIVPAPASGMQRWQITWNLVQSIALGTGWIAVSNSEQIKLFDYYGHEIRSISFDREIIAMRGYENILAIVYHETIPIWGSQQLSTQLFIVDSPSSSMLPHTHLPMKPGALLKSFFFSEEGMLFSQDSTSIIRAFSLETGQWTSVYVKQLEDQKRAWLIGVKNYQFIYWKTSDSDPEPTVAPRFAIKKSNVGIFTIGNYPEGAQQQYEQLIWNRFCLDHEKARSRLWVKLKMSRSESPFEYLSNSIMTDKEISMNHIKLDKKFYSLIEVYLKAKQHLKALQLSKSVIRSMQAGRELQELFDLEKLRVLAIELEKHCDQKERQINYEHTQTFSFVNLRRVAEETLKQKIDYNPMKRGVKKNLDPMSLLSQSMTQQNSVQLDSRMNTSQVSNMSQESMASQNEQANPFLKRKSTNEYIDAKKRQISEHVQKFGIKKKVDEKGMLKKSK